MGPRNHEKWRAMMADPARRERAIAAQKKATKASRERDQKEKLIAAVRTKKTKQAQAGKGVVTGD